MNKQHAREQAQQFISHLGLSAKNCFLVRAPADAISRTDVVYVDQEGYLSPLGLEDDRVVQACADILASDGAPIVGNVIEALAILRVRNQ